MNFTKDDYETILYSLEGYIQGNDDDKLCDELEDICNKIVEELDPEEINRLHNSDYLSIAEFNNLHWRSH